jgi:hypothetical protein
MAFAQAKLASFIIQVGYIVYPDGSVKPWKPVGVVERRGESDDDVSMVIWGPAFTGERLDRVISGSPPDEALDALRYWIRARRVLLNQDTPPLSSPAGALIVLTGTESPDYPPGTILFPPDLVVRRSIEAEGPAEWLNAADRWIHPDLSGEDAAVFAAAAMLYRILCGAVPFQSEDVDTVHEDIREGVYSPVRLSAPGLDKDLASLIARALAPIPREKRRTAARLSRAGEQPPKRPELADFDRVLGPPHSKSREVFFKDMDREELAKLNLEKKQFNKRKSAQVKTKRFINRNTAMLGGTIAGVGFLALIIGSIIQGQLNGPTTKGMIPTEVIDAYYGAFSTMDHTLMEACVTGKAGKDDIGMFTNLFVLNRVRQSYENTTTILPVQDWLNAGSQPLPEGYSVIGVSDMNLDELDGDDSDGSVSYRVSYSLWLPTAYMADPAAEYEAVVDPFDPSLFSEEAGELATYLPTSSPYTDEVRLVFQKNAWHIIEINRTEG